jgi:small subunit ribosomal protein S20
VLCFIDIRDVRRYHSRFQPQPFFAVRETFVPRIKSAAKHMRKSRVAVVRNRAQRSALRTALKRAKATDATPDQKRRAVQLLDRSARKGLIHRNAAARQKSKLASKI